MNDLIIDIRAKSFEFNEDGTWKELAEKKISVLENGTVGTSHNDLCHAFRKKPAAFDSMLYQLKEGELTIQTPSILLQHEATYYVLFEPNLLAENQYDMFVKRRREELANLDKQGQKILMIAQDSDFKRAVKQSRIIVDKSLIIETLLSLQKALVTFPRRWGKSFNLNMIKAFFETELDPLGRPLPEDLCINRKLFNIGTFDTNGFKARMKIMKDEQLVADHFGKYIVLKLDLICVEGSYSQLIATLSSKISELYKSFSFLESLVACQEDANLIKQGMNCANQPISEQLVTFLMTSLQSLARIVNSVYHRDVIILVDEYDYPTNHILHRISDPSEREKAFSLFKSLFSNAIQGNSFVAYAMLTGFLGLGKDVSLSPLKDLQEFNLTSTEFTPHYGFTHQEVGQLSKLFNLDSSYINQMEQMYNGYRFNTAYSVYNPWSLASCLNASYTNRKRSSFGTNEEHSTFKSYWVESGNIKHFVPLLLNRSVLEKFGQLLSTANATTTFTLIDSLCDYHMKILHELLSKSQSGDLEELNELHISILFTYLCHIGYFSIVKINGQQFTVGLPNIEVKAEISKLVSLAVNQSKYSNRASAVEECL